MGSVTGLLTSASALSQAVQDLRLDDALGMIGLARRRSWAARVLPSAGLIAASALVGAGIALLLTPKSGPELRQRLSERAGTVKERFAETVGDLERKLSAELDQARAA